MEDNKGLNSVLEGNEQPLDATSQKTIHVVQELNFQGDALNDENIDEYISDEIPVINVLVGYVGYGKTTFVTTLISQLMNEGHIRNFYFLDTDTMTGFEKRAYIRNIDIKTKKRSQRTSNNENYLLTLDIQEEPKGETRKIIISDRSGETYKNYQSNSDFIRQDCTLYHATRIFFFIDAVELKKNDLILTNNYDQLTHRLKSSGIFNRDVEVYIIVTKIDKIKEKKVDLQKKVEDITNKIQSVSGKKIESSFYVNSLTYNNDLEQVYTKLFEQKTPIINSEGEKLNWVAKILKEK